MNTQKKQLVMKKQVVNEEPTKKTNVNKKNINTKGLKIQTNNNNESKIINTILNNYPDILQYITILKNAINDVVNIEMNNNEFMINKNIIFSAKLVQLAYFLQNEQYKRNLLHALETNDQYIIIDYLMKYDPEVYESEWENESKRLTTSIIQNCIPNTTYKCPKCKEESVYSYSKQIRSGDEGETHFFKCCKCGYVWREE